MSQPLKVTAALLLALVCCDYSPAASQLDVPDAGPAIDAPGEPVDGTVVIGDADPPTDAPPPAEMFLEQVAGAGQTQSTGCTSTGGFIEDNAWYRVFPLASSGVTEPLTITKVSLWIWRATGVRQLELAIGPYTGGFQSSSFARPLFTVTSNQTVTVPTIAQPGNLVTITLDTPLVVDPSTTPQIAIRIESESILLGSGTSQTAHGYHGSNTCGQTAGSPPSVPNSRFILAAEGHL